MGPVQRVTQESDEIPDDIDEGLRPGLELGRRVGRYLAIVGADETDRAAQLWPELRQALGDYREHTGNPWRDRGLVELAEGRRKLPAAQHLLNAFEKTGTLTLALREAPQIAPKFTGQPGDVVAQAEALFRQQRSLTVAKLLAFHQQQGGTLSEAAALETVLAKEWNRDGDAWDELLPLDAYLTGSDLWARHDRAAARAVAGDEQAKVQVRRLLEAIRPATFEDLTEVSPRFGYVPLELVSGWISETMNARYGPVSLERKGGFVQLRGHDYTDADQPPIAPETLAFLGYVNHDPELFKPEPSDRSAGPKTREERAPRPEGGRVAIEARFRDVADHVEELLVTPIEGRPQVILLRVARQDGDLALDLVDDRDDLTAHEDGRGRLAQEQRDRVQRDTPKKDRRGARLDISPGGDVGRNPLTRLPLHQACGDTAIKRGALWRMPAVSAK